MKLAQSMDLAHREVIYMKVNTMESHTSHSAENIDHNKLTHYADQQVLRLAPKKPTNKSTKVVSLLQRNDSAQKKLQSVNTNCDGKTIHFARAFENKKVNLLIAHKQGPQGGSLYEYGATEIKLNATKEKLTANCQAITVIDVYINNTRITMQVKSGLDPNVIP